MFQLGASRENSAAHGTPRRHNRGMARKKRGGQPPEPAAVDGVVRVFYADEGWGVIDAPEVPGGCFVHFSNIEMDGYRELANGQRVRFTYERPGPGFLQDGCPYRSLRVWPAP
jgi:cold shock protein